jgi:predicted MFS family arabinose efflux permease
MSDTCQSTDSTPISSETSRLSTPASWAAVTAVGVGAFALVTTELLPVGLLPDIARELAVSDGQAGLMVTVPGIIAAIAAPLTLAVASRYDRRYVLPVLLGLLVISNALVASASSLTVLLAGRVLLGTAVGGFWTIAGSLGPRMRQGKEAARATSIILSGISLGTAAGVPAGALIGHLIGWRLAFAAASAIALLVTMSLIKLLPALPSEQASGLSGAFAAIKLRNAQVGLIAVALIFIGQFAAYTYITPFLNAVTHVDESVLSIVLLGYGVAGFFGNLFGGWAVGRNLRWAFFGTSLLVGAAVILLLATGASQALAVTAILAWGFGFGMSPITAQSWMLSTAPDRLESVSGLLVATIQAAIGVGALIGGVAVDNTGVTGPLLMGAVAALLSGGLIILGTRKA